MGTLLTTVEIVSTNWYGLNISFSFWFSSRAWFNPDITVAVSVACALILCWCLWELWDNSCCWSSAVTPICLLTANCHGFCVDCLCTFTLAARHHSKMTPKLGETLEVWGSQILSPGHHSKVGMSKIMQILMLKGLVCFPQELWLIATIFLTSICSATVKVSSVSSGFHHWL